MSGTRQPPDRDRSFNAAEGYESLHPGAAPTVEVCPGLYPEQVTILNSLVLTRAPVPAGLGAATIQLPGSVGGDQSTGLSSTNCQAKDGATGQVTGSSISGNSYTGPGNASSGGILAVGGCGSALVQHARFSGNRLTGNDVGIYLFDADPTCAKSAATPTDDDACGNVIENSHGYPGGAPSAGANRTGWSSTPAVGYQAGVSDLGNHDVICGNAISGAGYAPLDATSSLPNPPAPAFVRPVDIVTGPAIAPVVYGNVFDGLPYHPA